jgi:putative acetyltransferase
VNPIRAFQPADEDTVVSIWLEASKVATPFLSSDFLGKTRKQIREVWLQTAETWVYDDGNGVLGFIALIGNEVGGLFVHPEAQNRGIGRSLMDWASLHHEPLLTEVFEDNTVGRRFYERYGFRETNRYFHKPTEQNMIRMICMG